MEHDNEDRLFESLCQINANLEGLRVSVTVISELLSDHETRLRKLEIWKHNLTPIFAVLTFALGAAFSVAIDHII